MNQTDQSIQKQTATSTQHFLLTGIAPQPGTRAPTDDLTL